MVSGTVKVNDHNDGDVNSTCDLNFNCTEDCGAIDTSVSVSLQSDNVDEDKPGVPARGESSDSWE